MTNKSELNPRQWALYNYLKSRGDEWTTQKDVAYALDDFYDVSFNDATFHDSPTRWRMTKDIRVINENGVIQKVILSTPRGIKIANAEEFDRYIRKEISAAVRKLLRAKRKAQKGNLDGQMRMVFNSEREVYKAFIDSDRDIGARLRDARIAKGYSQAQAVTMLGIDAPMLSKFEKGHALPNKTTLAEMVQIYGVTSDYLLTGILSTESETREKTALQDVTGGN